MTSVAREQSNPRSWGGLSSWPSSSRSSKRCARRRSVQLKVCGSGNNVESWQATPVSNFDPKEFKVPEISGAWARPIAWNQGGYVAVLLTSVGGGKVAVRVVQVTAGRTHGLKLNYVESLLQRVVEEGFQVTSADVVFVVRRAINFQVGPVSAPAQSLQLLRWQSGNELSNMRVIECSVCDPARMAVCSPRLAAEVELARASQMTAAAAAAAAAAAPYKDEPCGQCWQAVWTSCDD
jgi:hypothetical protein